jgi:hypothetical protein
MDVPLLYPPFKARRHDARRSPGGALVKRIKSKMAALIWRAVLGYLQWNCVIFGLHGHVFVNLPLIVTLIITLELE